MNTMPMYAILIQNNAVSAWVEECRRDSLMHQRAIHSARRKKILLALGFGLLKKTKHPKARIIKNAINDGIA